MEQQEYVAAIREQQSLIRKLFSSRKKRTEVINNLTKERYKHIVGCFFRPQGEHFVNAAETIYYIYGVESVSNYVTSDRVDIYVYCRYFSEMIRGIDMSIVGMHVCEQAFTFSPDEDIEEILAPMWVNGTEAINIVKNNFNKMLKGYLSMKEGE